MQEKKASKKGKQNCLQESYGLNKKTKWSNQRRQWFSRKRIGRFCIICEVMFVYFNFTLRSISNLRKRMSTFSIGSVVSEDSIVLKS